MSAPDDPSDGGGVPRRTVLDLALAGTACGLGAMVAVPAIRFATPPAHPATGATQVVAGRREDFPENSSRTVTLQGAPVLVVALPGGELRAFDARCTHLGCVVQYRAAVERFECPCHGGRYALDGRVVAGPPPAPLRELPIEIRNGEVLVVRG